MGVYTIEHRSRNESQMRTMVWALEGIVDALSKEENNAIRETLFICVQKVHKIAQKIENSQKQAIVLTEIGIAEAFLGFGKQATQTADTILVNREKHVPLIAEALADVNDKTCLKNLLYLHTYDVNASLLACKILAKLYPEQAEAIAKAVHNGLEKNMHQSNEIQ